MNNLFVFIVAVLTATSQQSTAAASPANIGDTIIITHILDGKTDEWPKEKFNTDKETKISFASNNDKDYLFLALIIADISIQQKCMNQGMNLFIDPKGKKKESKGIEFPVTLLDGAEAAKNLDYMKLFGFSKIPAFVQSIKADGTVNIAYSWDSVSAMHIEYRIPLVFFEEPGVLLSNKVIGIGWKVKDDGSTTNSASPPNLTTSSRLVGVPSGTRPPVNTTPGSANRQVIQPASQNIFSFWIKHTIIL